MPRWLVFVQGIADPGQWGENLSGARQHPVRLSDPAKLVYSPHLYGPSFYGGVEPSSRPAAFRSPDFPTNLPSEWDALWGYLAAEKVAPVVVGETGGDCQGRDEIWHRMLATYLSSRACGLFYSLSPDTPNVGGLLADDWETPLQTKLDIISILPATPVRALIQPGAGLWAPAAQAKLTQTRERHPLLSHTAQVEYMCSSAGAERDLRREVPPLYCYHLNAMDREACERRFVTDADGLKYRCKFSMSKCTKDSKHMPCSEKVPPRSLPKWSEAPAPLKDPPSAAPTPLIAAPVPLVALPRSYGLQPVPSVEDDAHIWIPIRTGVIATPSPPGARPAFITATGLISLTALVVALMGLLQRKRRRTARHVRVSTADDDDDENDTGRRGWATEEHAHTPTVRGERAIRTDELDALDEVDALDADANRLMRI